MRTIAMLALATFCVSCGTPGIQYEYVDQNGNPVKFSMNADMGVTTNEGITDQNDVNLPIIGALTNPGGGGVDQSRVIAQTPAPNQGSITLPDGTRIEGVVTTSPVIRERWTGARGALKSVAATIMWWKTNDEMGKTIRHKASTGARESITNNKTQAGVDTTTIRETEKTRRVLSRNVD